MLVLLSFALVLVATVLLVLGLLSDDGLTLIYISITSSVAAAIVLLVALRLNKPRAGEQRAAAPAPILEPELVMAGAPASAPTTIEPTPSQGAESEWLASEQDAWPDDEGWDAGDEVDFPIADYDTLSVGQILPLLPQLYSDEIDVVEERERLTKARPQVLAKLAELRDTSGVTDPLASYTEATVGTSGWDDEDWFPIEDYESLSAAQILPLLPELDDEELTLVRTRELSLGRRRSLLDEIDRKLGIASAPVPARRAAPPRKSAATRKAAASTSSASKAASKKAPAAKKAAPARKAAPTAKAAPTRKAAPTAKAAPTRKAATTTKAAPTRKAAPTAKAAPARKATTSVKATTKKAAPAVKATAKKATAKKATAKKATATAKKSARR